MAGRRAALEQHATRGQVAVKATEGTGGHDQVDVIDTEAMFQERSEHCGVNARHPDEHRLRVGFHLRFTGDTEQMELGATSARSQRADIVGTEIDITQQPATIVLKEPTVDVRLPSPKPMVDVASAAPDPLVQLAKLA